METLAGHHPPGRTINPSVAATLANLEPSQWVVLGIESSCDDTAAAVVRGDGVVLSHQIASQVRRVGYDGQRTYRTL